ncbi:uncharacterized protein [Palaemon carinicauda]|uniref:uncharacterized protein isoform X2 n=1 Tax=Palaemon carinicauda TaxID=392227 RepID=UPI0035B66DEB
MLLRTLLVDFAAFSCGFLVTMFSVDLFFSDPKGKLNTIVCAKKSELLALAAKFEVTVSSRDRKDDIKNAILDYLVEEESVEEHEARKYKSTKKDSSDVEHMRLAIQLEQVKLEVDIERERHKLAIDKERKKYELEMEKARLDHEASLTQNMEIERSRISVEQRIRLMNLESNQPLKFDLAKSLKLVPEFTETDVDSFFRNFEDIASNMKWPVDQWVWLIKSKVQGKAAIVVSNLVGERNYTVVKQAILDAYMVTAEGLGQRFRQYIKSNAQTWYEFANEKLRLFNKWLKAANVNNFEELVNLIVTEEFTRKLPQNIRMHIADREEEDLKKSAMLADHFFLIHKTHKGTEMFVKQGKATGFSGEKEGVNYCSYCKQQGHDINECKNPTCKKSKFFGSKLPDPDAGKYKDSKFSVKGKGAMHCSTPESDALFSNYISEGTVTIPNGTPVKVRILRDTGSTQSMVLHSAVPTISLLDEKVLVRDLSNTNSLPLAELNLNCEFVSGKVKIAVINTPFPVHDVQVLLGNDLAGQLTLPNLILYNQPLDNNSNDLDIFEHFIEESNFISDLGEHDIEEVETDVDTDRCDPIENFVGVVTRAKAKQAVNEGVPDIVKTNIPYTNSELINLQRADTTLTNALKQASTKEGKVPCYYFDKGVLFRLYRPRKLSSNDTWANKEQLVVPLTLRKNILSVAHQADSHLGVSKTYKRITNDFFWPGMKHDVFEFVKECHVCQVVGKPNEVIPKAPLVPIVIPHEPFSKVIIDCVGPLPKTKKGNQYILTILCPTTRYPIAIPLGNICARNIVKHLLKVFTTYGFPKEIQSDRGTNFTSDLFNETLREFNVKHILASPYHPQSQGALERHHQTLKSLLRKFCMETGTDWDESLDFILFVIREVPNDSLGMSPFEMLFGHKVRGPLQVLKDKMLNNDTLDNVTVGQYVDKLKCNFEKVHNFAFNNLKGSQDVMKENFDLKTKVRKFKEGDSVLVYFPTPSSPLQHKFSGPYIIQKCVNNNNYIISTPDRRKSTQLVHVNLIKKYHGNPPVALHCLSDSNVLDFKRYNASAHQSKTPMPHDVDLNHSNDFVSWTDSANQEILQNILVYLQHLPRKQRSQLAELFRKYRSICGDVPQRCSDVEHDIELQPGTRPIRQHYYRTSLEKQQRMKEEVSYLLKNGLATRSTSAWASPCLLVPKPND